MKRLQSDLNDTANDASSYEGIFSNSVGPSAVGTNSGGDGNDSPDPAGSDTAAGVKLDGGEEEVAAAKRSAEWTSPGDDGVGDMPTELPPGKRQKSEETGGGGDGEAGTAAVANGMAFLKAPSGASGDAAGGGGGGGSWGRGGEDKQEIARMGELELREQLAVQSRLVTDMMKEIARLKRHGSGSACGTLDAPTGAVSALPVRWFTCVIARFDVHWVHCAVVDGLSLLEDASKVVVLLVLGYVSHICKSLHAASTRRLAFVASPMA